jgi:hypothetical protein
MSMTMRKILLASIAALSVLSASAAHADTKCAMANPPVDKEGTDDRPLYYREPGAPGLLHLRLRPNAKSEWRARVQYGDVLYIDTTPNIDLFKDWKYVFGIFPKRGPEYTGWVRTKYIKWLYDCPEEEEPQPTPSSLPPPVIKDAREDWCKWNDPTYAAMHGGAVGSGGHLSISDANAPEITKFHASVVTTTESEVTEITET